MYKLVFGHPKRNWLTLFEGSLVECIKRRYMSGDLILNPQNDVLNGTAWLFDWELVQPDCYARKMQREGWWY